MVGRDLLELHCWCGSVVAGGELVPEQRTRPQRSAVVRVEIRQQNDVLERRQPVDDAPHLRAPLEALAAVTIAVDAEHQLRRELRESIEHTACAEIRTAARPDRADAGGREHRDHGIGRVRQAADDPVTLDDSQPAQRSREPPHACGELVPGQAGRRLPLAQIDQHLGTGPCAGQYVLRVIESGSGEPFRAGHGAPAQRARRRHARADVEVLPERAPETLEILHRPAPERRIIVESAAPFAGEPVHEPRQLCALDARRVGRPEQVTLPDHTPLPGTAAALTVVTGRGRFISASNAPPAMLHPAIR